MDFGSHMLQMLGAARHGQVEVTWHDPVEVSAFANRKLLARAVEESVRGPHPHGATD